MIRVCLAAGAMLVSSAAIAGPLDGRWALDRADCARESGTSDRVPVTIAGSTMDFYESVCEIGETEPIGEQDSAWRISRTCRGEGERWPVRSIFAIDRDAAGTPRQLIEINLDDGFVIVRQYCD